MKISNDKEFIVSISKSRWGKDKYSTKVFKLQERKEILQLDDAALAVISTDHRLITSTSQRRSIRIYDIDTGERLYSFEEGDSCKIAALISTFIIFLSRSFITCHLKR